MNPVLSKYLSEKQYNYICRYWKNIERMKNKLNRYVHAYPWWEDGGTDDECEPDPCYERMYGEIQYLEEEYAKYVKQIGFEFNDRTQDETLFMLLNEGYELN